MTPMKWFFETTATTILRRSICPFFLFVFTCNSARAVLFTLDITRPDGSQIHEVFAQANDSFDGSTSLPNGGEEWKGSDTQIGLFNMQFSLSLYSDPSLTCVIALTNTSDTALTFTPTVLLPTIFVATGARCFGSSAVSVADSNADGTAVLGAPSGSAIYTALINSGIANPGIAEQTLFGAPATISVLTTGGVNVDSASFSNTVVTAATIVIGIQHNFSLTPGDTATVNSTFTVVPEPGGGSLAVMAAVGLVACRARQHGN
jgi:hypothetical protein